MSSGYERAAYAPGMLILAIILFGMVVSAGAQWILGRTGRGVDWTMAFVSGIAGSFVSRLLSA